MSTKAIRSLSLGLVVAVVGPGLGLVWSFRREEARLTSLANQARGWGCQVHRYENANPAWEPLRKVLGRDFVDRVVGHDGYYIALPMDGELKSDQLARLLDFRPLVSFHAMNAQRVVDDDWIAGIRDPEAVRSLGLAGTRITDRSVPRLLAMKHLNLLDIQLTKVGDESIARLLDLPALTQLRAYGPGLRSVALIDLETTDDEGRPTKEAGRACWVRGRVAVDPRLGRPRVFHCSVYQAGTPGSFGGDYPPTDEVAPGVFGFAMMARMLPPGRSKVQVVADVVRTTHKPTLAWRFEASSVQVDPATPAAP